MRTIHTTRVLRLAGAIILAFATAEPTSAQAPAASSKPSDAKLERIHRNNRRKAEEMMAKDSRAIPGREMGELEKTYQAGNTKNRGPESLAALKTVLEKWPKTNRAGCSALYLGRWSAPEEQEKYLRLAISEYSKCYYLDGTSVGGYARLILGSRLKQAGKADEAKVLFDEIRKDYAEAEDHTNKLIVDLIPQ